MLLSFFVEHTMHVLLKYYYISEIRLRNFLFRKFREDIIFMFCRKT